MRIGSHALIIILQSYTRTTTHIAALDVDRESNGRICLSCIRRQLTN